MSSVKSSYDGLTTQGKNTKKTENGRTEANRKSQKQLNKYKGWNVRRLTSLVLRMEKNIKEFKVYKVVLQNLRLMNLQGLQYESKQPTTL